MSTPFGIELERLLGEEDFVRKIARSLLFDEHEVDDVVQQTWLQAMRRPPREAAGAKSWLAAVARNQASNQRRGEGRRRAYERAEPPKPDLPSAEDILAKEETRRHVVDAVAALPDPYRTVILLRYFEGMPPRKIAKALDENRDTVATRLKRGLQMLRSSLDGAYDSRRSWALALIPLAISKPVTAAVLATEAAAFAGALITMKSLIAGAVLALVVVLGLTLGSGLGGENAGPRAGETRPRQEGLQADAGERAAPAERPRPVATRPFTDTAPDVDPDAGPASVTAALAGFRGRLIDPSGQPAGGQLVRVLSLDLMASFGSTSDLMGPPGAAGIRVANARTTQDGEFVIHGIWPGSLHALHAGIDGPHPTIRMLERTPGPTEIVDLGDVLLTQLGGIQGTVVDEAGEPMEGVRVWAADLPPILMRLAPVDRFDEDGALMLSLPEVDPTTVKDAGEWHRRVRKHLGRNVVTAGKNAPFVQLDMPPWARELLANLPRSQTRTGKDGRFVLNGLPADSVVVVAQKRGRVSGQRTVRVTIGETVDAGALTLKAGRTFTARVIDAKGEPVMGAEVRLAPRPRIGLTGILFAGPLHTSDAEGRVSESGLPSGRIQVAYRGPGAPTWTVTPPIPVNRDAELALPSGSVATVIVTSAQKRQLEELEVRLQQGPPLGELAQAGLAPRRILRGNDLVTRRRADGAVLLELRNVAPGVHTLLVRAKGHAIGCTTVIATTESEPVEMTLAPAAALEVVVTDARTEPIHGARVFVQEPDNPAWARSVLWSYAGLRGWQTLGRALGSTGPDGKLRANDLPLGRSFVTVQHPAFGTHTWPVELPRRSLEVELPDPGSIVGRVWDNGMIASPSSWRVVATLQSAPEQSAAPAIPHQAVLDREGRFRLAGLAPGRWKVEASESLAEFDSIGKLMTEAASGFNWSFADRSVEVIVAAGEEARIEFDVDTKRLPPTSIGSTIRGRVRFDGVPQKGLHVAVRHGSTRTGGDGTFEISGLRPGEHSIDVFAEFGTVWWNGKVMVAYESEQTVDIDIATSTLEIEIQTIDGQPAGGHHVICEGQHVNGATFRMYRKSGADGHVRMRVPAGRTHIKARGIGGAARRVVDLPASGVEAVTIDLQSAGVLAGRARTTGEAELHQIYVITEKNGRTSTSVGPLDTHGRFSFPDLAPGRYTFRIVTSTGTYNTIPDAIDLTAEGKLDVELQLGERRP